MDRQAVVALPEDVSLANSGPIREQLLSVINRGAAVLIVDMTATVSCDHSGADAISRAYQRAVASGTEIRLVVSHEIVRRTLTLSGVDRLVSIYPTLEAAWATGAAAAAPGEAEACGPAETAPPRPDPDVGLEVAWLDRDGVIVSVNEAWRLFAAANGGDPARTGPGMSYLGVCAAAAGDPVAEEVAAAIHRALAGDMPGPLGVEVPCHSPHTARWFDVLISTRRTSGGEPVGATVTLSLARSEPLALATAGQGRAMGPGRPGTAVRSGRGRSGRGRSGPGTGLVAPAGPAPALTGTAASAVTWQLAEAIEDGVALTDADGVLVLVNRRLADMFGYTRAELLGLPVNLLIPADLRTVHGDLRAAYARAAADRPMGARAQLVGLRKDGSTSPCGSASARC